MGRRVGGNVSRVVIWGRESTGWNMSMEEEEMSLICVSSLVLRGSGEMA